MEDLEGEGRRVGTIEKREAVLGVAASNDTGGHTAGDLAGSGQAAEVLGVMAGQLEGDTVHSAGRGTAGTRLVDVEVGDGNVLRFQVLGHGVGAEEEGSDCGGGETHLDGLVGFRS